MQAWSKSQTSTASHRTTEAVWKEWCCFSSISGRGLQDMAIFWSIQCLHLQWKSYLFWFRKPALLSWRCCCSFQWGYSCRTCWKSLNWLFPLGLRSKRGCSGSILPDLQDQTYCRSPRTCLRNLSCPLYWGKHWECSGSSPSKLFWEWKEQVLAFPSFQEAEPA